MGIYRSDFSENTSIMTPPCLKVAWSGRSCPAISVWQNENLPPSAFLWPGGGDVCPSLG